VLVKPTKEIELSTFLAENQDNLAVICQILNINAKQCLKNDDMVELSPGSYFSQDKSCKFKAEGGINVWRGYAITVAYYNKKLFLQVDPCSRIVRTDTFLQILDKENLSNQEFNAKYKGTNVLRNYGSPKTFKI
jgi:hypothetical protein